jgi:extradiol dioxygenase family protein
MADIESISHCGVLAADTRELAETMQEVLGSQRLVTGERAYANRRGGAPHPHEMVGDFMMVTFPYPPGWTMPPIGQLRGGVEGGEPRHAFATSRAQFAALVARFAERGIPFEGPLEHPVAGPLGESIYVRDNSGNFFEICWRRDEDTGFNPAPLVGRSVVGTTVANYAGLPGVAVEAVAGVVLEVDDLARARAFYAPIFDLASGEWRATERRLVYQRGAQSVELELRQRPRTFRDSGYHQAYQVPASQLEGLVEDLESAGHPVHRWQDDHPDERTLGVYVDDPSGNRVQLIPSADARQLLDHVAIEVYNLDYAEHTYVTALGGRVDYYHGWRAEDRAAARMAVDGTDPRAPWTRYEAGRARWDATRTAFPNGQLFVAFGATRLALTSATAVRQEPREEMVKGTPRMVLRTALSAAQAAEALAAFKLRFVRAGRRLFMRDPDGNFAQLDCAA